MRNYFLMEILGMILLCSLAHAELIDNGNGTVSDTETSLMWQQGEAETMTSASAISYCENLVLPAGGYDDWRLPNRNELQSLVDYSRCYPAINQTFFPGAKSNIYWSSTISTCRIVGPKFMVDFREGGISTVIFERGERGYVRAVRGGN